MRLKPRYPGTGRYSVVCSIIAISYCSILAILVHTCLFSSQVLLLSIVVAMMLLRNHL